MRKGLDLLSAMAWATDKELSAFNTSSGALAGSRRFTYRSSIFVHARNIADRQALISGSKVSFIYEADEKVGRAKEVTVEEIAEAVVLDEGPRLMGTVKVSLIALPYPSRQLIKTRVFCKVMMSIRGED